MKFSNGYWLSKKGYTQNCITRAYEAKISDSALYILAPCKRVNGRGDTLGGPVLHICLTAPLPGVIRVKAYHFSGTLDKGPHFQINDDKNYKPQITLNEQNSILKSGDMSVRVGMGDTWNMDFYWNGDKITSSSRRGLSYVQAPDGTSYMRERLDLDVGECVYGLGERFTNFVRNGQSVDIWNSDGGTCTEQAYKNIPFYVTSKGYGVFVNHTEKVSFEVGSEVVSKVQFSVPGEYIDYYVIGGPTIKKVLSRYTALTGRPPLPPAWSFGLWLSTSFITDYDEKTVGSFIDGMAERNIPLSVFHFDCFWMKEFNWCNFEWDSKTFPDPQGMLKRLKAKGLKICVWINPYISQESKLFSEAVKNGYLIKRTDGSVWQWDMWQPGMGIVDFTNSEACSWFSKKLECLLDLGVDCFKTDFGERIPDSGVVYFDGSDPQKMHNYYTYLYNSVVFNTISKKKGAENSLVFARSATAGSQRFPIHWGGDCAATFQSMAESLRGGLSLGLSGFGFWSHDIGGFESTATADLYKRWVAFGLLSSHSRLHGNSSYRVPWLFDDEASDVLRFFTNLKCRLMPYIYKTACEARNFGWPVMRAMPMEFENDPACSTLDRQYMLGGSLLVAPVFSEKGNVSYYLPNGKWVRLFTGETVQGGHWNKESHDYFSLPLLVRPNSIVAIGSRCDRPDYDYAEGITFLVSCIDDDSKAEIEVCDVKGVKCMDAYVSRSGNTLKFETSGAEKPWSVKFAGIQDSSVKSVEGANIKMDKKYLTAVPNVLSSKIILNLKDV